MKVTVLPRTKGQAALPLVAIVSLAALPAVASADADPAAALERAIAAAESSLRAGEVQTAESQYRSALAEGWLLMGALERVDGRLGAARDAFSNASTSAVDNRHALQALALVQLQLGEAAQGEELLRVLARKDPRDTETRRLLAQALAATA